jgi:hypothetical protein
MATADSRGNPTPFNSQTSEAPIPNSPHASIHATSYVAGALEVVSPGFVTPALRAAMYLSAHTEVHNQNIIPDPGTMTSPNSGPFSRHQSPMPLQEPPANQFSSGFVEVQGASATSGLSYTGFSEDDTRQPTRTSYAVHPANQLISSSTQAHGISASAHSATPDAPTQVRLTQHDIGRGANNRGDTQGLTRGSYGIDHRDARSPQSLHSHHRSIPIPLRDRSIVESTMLVPDAVSIHAPVTERTMNFPPRSSVVSSAPGLQSRAPSRGSAPLAGIQPHDQGTSSMVIQSAMIPNQVGGRTYPGRLTNQAPRPSTIYDISPFSRYRHIDAESTPSLNRGSLAEINLPEATLGYPVTPNVDVNEPYYAQQPSDRPCSWLHMRKHHSSVNQEPE